MNDLVVNTFEGRNVRTHTDESGEIWFVAQDVIEILEIKYQRHALRKLDDSERGGVILPSSGQNREFATVSESGLYSLILSSNKKTAQAFKKWVTKEVLPSIRKSGQYSIKEMTPAQRLMAQAEMLLAQEKAIEEMSNKIDVVGIEAKQDHDTLSHDQITELTFMMTHRYKQLGLKDPRHHGLMKKAIKDTCFGRGFRTVATFKDIPRRDFQKAKEIISSYKP